MQIAVITVQRKPMYLYNTLASLLASHPFHAPWIDVFVGTPEFDEISLRLDHYRELRPSDRVFPHEIPAHLWKLIEPLPPKLRAVGNFIAALRSGSCDLMLFEDDILIKPAWIPALYRMRASFLAPALPHLFVSLYSHKDLRAQVIPELAPLEHPAVILERPVIDFYGTLGLFVPAKHRQPLAEAAMVHLQPTDPRPVEQRWPFDEIVKTYVNDHRECTLAVSIPSYVDHVGEVSIINPTHGIRRAPMF